MPDTRHFAEDLDKLKVRLLFMGGLAAQSVLAALDALRESPSHCVNSS